MSNARIGELERRVANIVRPGVILEADYDKARVKVKLGRNQTAWIPWVTGRACNDRTWHAPEVGEQVLVVAPSGNLASGFVMAGGIYKNDKPANGNDPTVSRTTFADGAVVEYDRSGHNHLIQLPSGSATVSVGGSGITEVTPGKITHKVGSDSVTEIVASKITHKVGGSSVTEIEAAKITHTVGTAVTELTPSKLTHKMGATALIEITATSIKFTCGTTVFELTPTGTTLQTPQFAATQV